MKTIKIPRETYRFLLELTQEIENQDNRATAAPYAYMIREEVDYEDEEGETTFFNQEGESYNYEELEEAFRDDLADDEESVLKKLRYDSIDDFDPSDTCVLKEYADSQDYRELGISKEMRYSSYNPNCFLTEKAAKQHIKSNHYHFNKPQDYVIHLWRNPEMKNLLKAVFEIVGKEEFLR